MSVGQYIVAVVFSAETVKDVDVSSTIVDARACSLTLFDSGGNLLAYALTALSASTVRITADAPVTDTFTLILLGQVKATSAASPAVATSFPPSLDVFNTYAEARDKIQVDWDLQDETFITPNELIGYFNAGIKFAESEILKIDEDYFKTSTALPLVTGQSAYDYPPNIYAGKVRGLVYANGSIIYDILRMRRRNQFENLAFANQYSESDDYQWFPTNDGPGRAKINLVPPSRETAILSPSGNDFAPVTLWYIRRANRVPLIGQYVRNWDVVDQASAVSAAANTLTVASTFVTGDAVQLTTSGVMPGGLTSGTTYYAILGSGVIQLAATKLNATQDVPINITTPGTGAMSIAIAATQAIVDATLIDIPEFVEFLIQYAKCQCLAKEFAGICPEAQLSILASLKDEMVSSLTEAQPDDQNTVEGDFSPYREMS